jgi:hypothetical protein
VQNFAGIDGADAELGNGRLVDANDRGTDRDDEGRHHRLPAAATAHAGRRARAVRGRRRVVRAAGLRDEEAHHAAEVGDEKTDEQEMGEPPHRFGIV